MIEPSFEYDAPMIHDFTQNDENDQEADKWFDYKTGSKATVLRFSDDFAKSKSKNVEERSKSDERRKVNNLVTSLDEWNKTKKTGSEEPQTSQTTSETQSNRPQRRTSRQRPAKQPSLPPLRVPVKESRKPESKKTTEDVELERISLLQEETKKALELSRASHELVKKRHSHTGPGRKDGQTSKPPTVVKPYNLRTSRKRPADGEDESQQSKKMKYVSMAAEIERFQKATPIRFRTKSRLSLQKGPQRVKHKQKACCMPSSPQLLTRQRARILRSSNLADKEEKEIQEMKSHVFKATVLNPKIIEKHGAYGLPQKKETHFTVPIDIHLATETRSSLRQAKESVTTDGHDEGPVRVARPAPDTSYAFMPVLTHKFTVPNPFNFDGKYQDPTDVKEELSQIEDDKLKQEREFHAKPMPDTSIPFTPMYAEERDVTKSEPFQLHTEIRGQDKAREWMEQLKAEMSKDREKRQFKAQPCNVVHEPAFEPQLEPRETKPLHDVRGFVLNTDIRAKQRQELAERKRQHEAENEHIEKQRAEEREKREQETLKEMRMQLVHRAQPMPEFMPFVVQQSSLPPTIAKAPHFYTDERIRGDISRSQNSAECM